MAAFNKFDVFVLDLGEGSHQLQAAGHALFVYLSNVAPVAATDLIKANIAEISAGFGYTAGGEDAQNTYTESGGTGSCIGIDITWTAAGGSIGAFRYAILYNDTQTSPVDPLIGWWDYGSSITLNDGESFTVDFGASMFTIA